MKSLFFALCALCAATMAPAATQTVDFDFGLSNNFDTTSLITGTSDRVVTIVALKDWSFGSSGTAAQIRVAADYGLGVTSNPKGNRIGTQKDNAEAFELLFDQTVHLLGFSTHDNAAFGEVITWHAGSGETRSATQDTTGGAGVFDFDLAGGLTGTRFFMTVEGGTGTFLQSVQIAPAPVPGSLLLAGSALLGLSSLRRFSRR